MSQPRPPRPRQSPWHHRPSQQHPKADDTESSLISSAAAESSRAVAPATKFSLAMAPSAGSNRAASPAAVSSHASGPLPAAESNHGASRSHHGYAITRSIMDAQSPEPSRTHKHHRRSHRRRTHSHSHRRCHHPSHCHRSKRKKRNSRDNDEIMKTNN